MTAPHNAFIPAAAGLRPGWRFDPSDSPPQPLSSQALVLAGLPPHPQPPSIRWAAIPRTYPSQQPDHSYSGNAYDNPLQSIAYQAYQSYPIMAATAEDVSIKKVSPQSRRRVSSAHVTAEARYAGHAQMIPPPPPPQSSQASVQSIPRVPFDAQTRTGSPFIVYHICGVCHKPRSKSYHARHPVNSGESIHLSTCHRCKSPKGNYEEIIISRTQERERSPIPRIQEIESDDECAVHLKVSKGDYLSDWMEQSAVSAPVLPHEPPKPQHHLQPRHSHTKIRTTVYIDDCETSAAPTRVPSSPEPRSRPIVYRHVKAPQHVDGIQHAGRMSEPEFSEPPLSPRAAMATARTTSIHQSSTNWAPPSVQPLTCPPSSRGTSITSSKVREIAQEEIRRTQALPSTVVHAYARSTSHRSASITPSEVRKIVCEETSALVSNVPSPPPLETGSKSSSVTPSEVRRIARREIKGYRGAERAMEAHPNPYSHGRMLPIDEESPQNAQAASTKPVQSNAAISRPDSKNVYPESTVRSISDGQPEYFYISRTAQAVPPPTASAPRPLSYANTTDRERFHNPASAVIREPVTSESEMEHIIVEKDVVEEWPDATRERHYREQEVFLDGPVRRRRAASHAASTVNPSSSISQRTQRAPPSSHYAQNSPEEEYSTAFYGIREETNRASKDVQIGRITEDRTPAAGSGITRPTATIPADKESRPKPRHAAVEDHHGRPYAESERLHDAQQPHRGRETVHVRERYAEDDFLPNGPVSVAAQRSGRAGGERVSNAADSLFSVMRSDYPADSELVVVDERPVGDDTYVRETHTSPATNISRDSDEITVWPGDVHGQPRANRAPMDSVALHRQRFGMRQDHDKRDPPGPRLDRNASYIVPRGSIRRPPSPPKEAQIIREDRRYYREGSPSGERIITERIIRACRESPERRGRHLRTSQVGAYPDQHAKKFDEDIRFVEPSARPRSILCSPSTSPGERLGFYTRDAHVTFASKDNIAPMPQSASSDTTEKPRTQGVSRYHQRPRGHGYDGAASSRTRSERTNPDQCFYERERGRTSRRYDDQVEGVEDYKPEMNQVLTRALSESPSRERAGDLKKKAEAKKRVRIEMMTEAHGPYHAEVSPSPSMEVLTDGSQTSHREPDPQTSARRSARGHGMQRMESIDERLESVEPGWLRVTKVKQYISPDGRPYEVVEEGIVLDDQQP